MATPCAGSYQLQDGPARGRYVYVTEDVIPTVTPGPRILPAGAPIANLSGGGNCIEIGWANGPTYSTVAASLAQQSQAGDAGNNRTYCGQQMSDLLGFYRCARRTHRRPPGHRNSLLVTLAAANPPLQRRL